MLMSPHFSPTHRLVTEKALSPCLRTFHHFLGWSGAPAAIMTSDGSPRSPRWSPQVPLTGAR